MDVATLDHLTRPPELEPETDFDEGARIVLGYLRAHLPLSSWAVTRVDDDHRTVLHADDGGAGETRRGDQLRWDETLDVRMLAGQGPRIAPDITSVPTYRDAPLAQRTRLGAYAASPMIEAGGRLFGVLTGSHPEPVDRDVLAAEDLLELVARALGLVLSADRQRQRAAMAATDRIARERDPDTGLGSPRAWAEHLTRAQRAASRYGDPSVALRIEITGGDTERHAVARALTSTVRTHDVVARVTEHGYGVLLQGAVPSQLPSVVGRLRVAMEHAGATGRFGWSPSSVVDAPDALQRAVESAITDPVPIGGTA